MKNVPTFVITGGLIVVGVAMFFAGLLYERTENFESKTHVCIDSTHSRCDGQCECVVNKRSYQIDTWEDSTVIYDGERRVGVLLFDNTSKLDSLIMADNE